MWRISILVATGALIAQASQIVKASDDESSSERAVRASSRDVKLPQALVARIEREYKEFLAKQEGAHDKDKIKRSLINFSVELSQRRPGALHEDMRVNTPTGGGVIDFADIVAPVRAAFQVKLLAHKEDGQPLSTSRVFFVSRAKPRILGGEEYGDGCDKYMEITNAYRKKWERDGFEVFTADQRYVSVLGGTFIFVEYAKDALYVGGVTFTDSRYPNLQCE